MSLRLAMLATIAIAGIARGGNVEPNQPHQVAQASSVPKAANNRGVAVSCQNPEAAIQPQHAK